MKCVGTNSLLWDGIHNKSPAQKSRSAIPLLAAIVVTALLLHWGVGEFLIGTLASGLHATITVLAALLAGLASTRQYPSSRALVNENGGGGLDNLLLQTHPEFSTHFAGANDDLSQVQALLSDAIEKLLSSFDGMHHLIQAQRDAAISVTGAESGGKDLSIESSLDETSETMKLLVSSNS
jgi:hypothetical protein